MTIRRKRVDQTGPGPKAPAPPAPRPPPSPPTTVEEKPRDRLWKVQIDQLNEGTVLAAGLAALRTTEFDTWDRLALRVRPDSFQLREHQTIWAALVELRRKGLAFDVEALRRHLADGATVIEYVCQLRDSRPDFPPNIDYFVANLEWDKVRAEATKGPAVALLDALQDVRTPSDRVQSLAKQLSQMLAAGGTIRQLRSPEVLRREANESIVQRVAGLPIHPFGLVGFDIDDSGEPKLNSKGLPLVAPGAVPGGFTVVTAVRGMGKSSVIRAMCSGLVNVGRRVLYGAWEEPDARKVLPMLAAYRLGIPRSRVTIGRLSPEEIQAMDLEIEIVLKAVRFVENPLRTGRARSTEEVLDRIHGYIADSACDVFIADLLRRAFRFESVGDEEEALFRLQAIAAETGCHIIAAQQQVHKQTEQRKDPRPTLEGIKGPGAWSEVPDNVFGVFREAMYKNVPDEELQIHVLKQRDGGAPLNICFKHDPSDGFLTDGAEREYNRRRFAEEEDAADPALRSGKKRIVRRPQPPR